MADCGTYAGYRAGCKCRDCKTASAAYQFQRTRDASAGLSHSVGPVVAARYIDVLLGAGASYASIARSSGVHWDTVRRIHVDKPSWITRRCQDAILGVQTDAVAYVPGWHLRRLACEMEKSGITMGGVASALRCNEDWVWRLLRSPRHQKRTLRKFETIYRYLARQGIVPASVLEEIA